MSPEKNAELVAKYPKIFAEHYEGRFDFECGDGWFELIDNLCSLLMIDETLTPVATQVKEKFGTLRFYVNEATDYQYELIDRANTLSQNTCEVCGAPGTADYKRSWIKTLCEEHRTK
jgi:hypothetical protein